MTVRELITQLLDTDLDAEVRIESWDDGAPDAKPTSVDVDGLSSENSSLDVILSPDKKLWIA